MQEVYYMLALDKLAAQREHGFYGVLPLGARATRMPRSNTRTSAGCVLPVKEVLGGNAACGVAEAS